MQQKYYIVNQIQQELKPTKKLIWFAFFPKLIENRIANKFNSINW